MGIKYPDSDADFIQIFLETPKFGDTVKFFFDTEGDFLELSAYAFEIQMTKENLEFINSLNNIVDNPLKMLKFSILKSGKVRIEFDAPKNNIIDSSIIPIFIKLVLSVVDIITDIQGNALRQRSESKRENQTVKKQKNYSHYCRTNRDHYEEYYDDWYDNDMPPEDGDGFRGTGAPFI